MNRAADSGDARRASGRSAALVGAGVLLSRVSGLLREVVLAGFLGTKAVADAFMASEEHCKSLLDPDLTDIGAGARRDGDDGRIGWVVLTGEPRP